MMYSKIILEQLSEEIEEIRSIVNALKKIQHCDVSSFGSTPVPCGPCPSSMIKI